MVNTLLFVVVGLSLLIWLAQEILARANMQSAFDRLAADGKMVALEQLPDRLFPAWHEWLLKVVIVIWLVWGASIFLLKDGDFALILVVLTLFSGVVVAIDKLFFSRRRQSYVASDPAREYLESTPENKREQVRSFLISDFIVAEYAKSFFPVLAVVLILRSFIVEPFQIPSASMVPTLEVGDYILVNKFTYGVRLPVLGTKIIDVGEPQRGDVMVFFPPDDSRYFIKRVIGLPGDRISYHNKQLTINGEPAPQELIAALPDYTAFEEHLGTVEHTVHTFNRVPVRDFSVVVDPGHYFMMGDNRDNSSDSRVWGQVPEANVVGKAFAVWMHWASVTELPSFHRAGAIR